MRRIASALAALLVAAILTGCVKNLPEDAVAWLAGQDGIAEARILTDNTGAWSSSGLVRGELEPGLDDGRLSDLLDRITDYQDEHGAVGFWLGRDEIDFVVAEDVGDTVALWKRVSEAPGIVSAIVADHDVRARTVRDAAVEAFDALDRLEGSVRLEAFSDGTALAADQVLDLQYDEPNLLAIEYRRPADCAPAPAVRAFTDSLLTRDEIPGATADLCTGITLDLPAEASLATAALDLRAELDERGLTDFPVQLSSQVEGLTTRFAAITPGDPELLRVLSVFEEDGVPSVDYSLGPDGNLAVTAYSVPTADLVALMQRAPSASGLGAIGLEGTPVAILGPLDRLPGLLEEAMALDAASDAFGSVQLGVGFGSVFLDSGVGADPDVDKAVADLRATGSTERRFVSVRYLNFQVDIVDDVAALADPDYVGAEVMQQFVDAWNAPH